MENFKRKLLKSALKKFPGEYHSLARRVETYSDEEFGAVEEIETLKSQQAELRAIINRLEVRVTNLFPLKIQRTLKNLTF